MAARLCSRLATVYAASGAARASGKLLATGTGVYGLYKALAETVPYAAGDDGGRRRFKEPPDRLVSRLPQAVQLRDAEAEHLLPALAPGEVRVHNLSDHAPVWIRQFLEDSAQAVLAALQQEARSRPDGFGRHILDTGVHVVFQFGDAAFALHPNVVVLPASILQGYLDGAKDGTHDMRTVAVAVQRMMAHEMAHLYLRHQPEQDRYGLYRVTIAGLAQHLTQRVDGWKEKLFGWAPPPNTATVFYQNAASKTKALQWQHVYEADEAACAVLARLRLPPDQWAVGLRQASAGQLASISSWVADIEKAGQSSEAAAAKVAAVVARMGWPSLAEGLAQLKAALAKNDVQWLQEQHARCRASHQWQLLVDAAGAEDESAVHIVGRTVLFPDLVVGPLACPEPAVLALLTDLADTQPPTDMRIARIEHRATQLPMMQRITAPPIELGGRFEAGNMARLIADRADAGIKAEAAAQQALRAAQLAAKREPGLFGAARRVARRRAAAAHKHTFQQSADAATQPAPQKPAGPAAQPATAQRTPPE